jgi:hypothetical protein
LTVGTPVGSLGISSRPMFEQAARVRAIRIAHGDAANLLDLLPLNAPVFG